VKIYTGRKKFILDYMYNLAAMTKGQQLQIRRSIFYSPLQSMLIYFKFGMCLFIVTIYDVILYDNNMGNTTIVFTMARYYKHWPIFY